VSEYTATSRPLEALSTTDLTPTDIQEYVVACIAEVHLLSPSCSYRINAPPTERPACIYADGVYDLLHFAHVLLLRQAKLAFLTTIEIRGSRTEVLGVHLLAGVHYDEVCTEHKNIPVMGREGRCEAVQHCQWVDEVIPNAPWVIDQAALDKVCRH
ncbi:hypothetical protein DICSQDRAFT_69929, partial [Dichomitus squalens LYAD-421 SS1]